MSYLDRYADKIKSRTPFTTVQLKGYRSQGGTYILASTPTINDDGRTHDLMAILPDDSVVKLRFNAYIDDVVELLARPKEPSCPYCGRTASEIPDVVFDAKQEEMSPGAFAREDSTYNRETNHFACNECYLEIGAPSSPTGWIAK